MPAAIAPSAGSILSPSADRGRSQATVATRRSFLGTGLVASGAACMPLPSGGIFPAGQQRLRVGLVGCGGRGTGAAMQCLAADPSVRVVAVGDLFADQVASAVGMIGSIAGNRLECPAARQFVGADSFQKVIGSGIDIVLLAAPPHLRPLHLEAAVAAGKHVYCERPVAVDVAGVVQAAAAAARGRAAGLALVSGFCFRRDPAVADLVARIHEGAIGRPLAVHAHASIGLPWRKPVDAGRDPGEEPIRNWISFTRFSGGHFVERHVEAIDRAAWVLGDLAPVVVEPAGPSPSSSPSCCESAGLPGGHGPFGDCAARTAVRYVFGDGRTIRASLDRRERLGDRLVETVVGSSGSCDLLGGTISNASLPARLPCPAAGRYQATIDALVLGVLAGARPHDGEAMCRSTLLAILGRMAAETGRPVPWGDILPAASAAA